MPIDFAAAAAFLRSRPFVILARFDCRRFAEFFAFPPIFIFFIMPPLRQEITPSMSLSDYSLLLLCLSLIRRLHPPPLPPIAAAPRSVRYAAFTPRQPPACAARRRCCLAAFICHCCRHAADVVTPAFG